MHFLVPSAIAIRCSFKKKIPDTIRTVIESFGKNGSVSINLLTKRLELCNMDQWGNRSGNRNSPCCCCWLLSVRCYSRSQIIPEEELNPFVLTAEYMLGQSQLISK